MLTRLPIIGTFRPSQAGNDILPTSLELFDKYRSALVSKPLSGIWRGYGSAIFMEFGRLTPQMRHDGSAGNPRGDVTVMIEWSWRIESERAILCGSDSDEDGWEEIFRSLVGREAQDVVICGRLPELSVSLAGGFYVASFMTAEGQPTWTIFDNHPEPQQPGWIEVRAGDIYENSGTKSLAATMTA